MPVKGSLWYADYQAMTRLDMTEAQWYALSRKERARHIAVPQIQQALSDMWAADKPKKHPTKGKA